MSDWPPEGKTKDRLLASVRQLDADRKPDPIALQKQLYELHLRLGGEDRVIVRAAEAMIRSQFLTLCHLRSVLLPQED
jgi:hypothetical protein